ncbi:tyrosine-type recombinase/integrase [Nonomuraea sp. 10N515B]|uniref:tyrosine-type recombinase/integrase n=1 Tax=Nonomuraea sp. 10N515B TaxID=3457422 RepID=UPI003FCE7325
MAHIAKLCNCRDPNGKKLGKSCPDLAKRHHGTWWARYEAPPGPDGKRRRPWAGPYPTKTIAEQEAKKLETGADSGRPVPDRKVKVGVYLQEWLDGKASLKPSTRRSYQEHIDLYYKPGVGHLNLVDLRESHLEKLYAAMRQINNLPAGEEPGELLRRLVAARKKATWTRDGENGPGLWQRRRLTPARIRRIHATISSALGSAHKRKLIEHNPAPHVELPKVPRRRPVVWTAARVEAWRKTGKRPASVMVWTPQIAGAFLDFCEAEEERLYPLYHLVATRGLRRGEVWGLEWPNVDLETKALALLEDEEDEDDGAEDDASLKSESSWRTVTLDEENVRLLKAWAIRQKRERLAAGEKWIDSGRVFTDELGAPLRIDYIGDHFDVLVNQAGLPPIRLHDLRHCAATFMLLAKVDKKVVSETLGHKQYAFTQDIYTSVVPELAEAAAEATVAVIPRRRREA